MPPVRAGEGQVCQGPTIPGGGLGRPGTTSLQHSPGATPSPKGLRPTHLQRHRRCVRRSPSLPLPCMVPASSFPPHPLLPGAGLSQALGLGWGGTRGVWGRRRPGRRASCTRGCSPPVREHTRVGGRARRGAHSRRAINSPWAAARGRRRGQPRSSGLGWALGGFPSTRGARSERDSVSPSIKGKV